MIIGQEVDIHKTENSREVQFAHVLLLKFEELILKRFHFLLLNISSLQHFKMLHFLITRIFVFEKKKTFYLSKKYSLIIE